MKVKDVLSDQQIVNRYAEIEKKINCEINHGVLHVKHVIRFCKRIAKAFKLPKHETDLLLISAALHDVGRGNEEHNIVGAKFAKEYLQGKMPEGDIEIICNAIKYHEKTITDPAQEKIGLMLKLADKLDRISSRFNPGFEVPERMEWEKHLIDCHIKRKKDTVIFVFKTKNMTDRQAFEKYQNMIIEIAIEPLCKNLILNYKLVSK